MSAFFDNKAIFPDPIDILTITVEVYAQPSVTGIYVNGEMVHQNKGDIVKYRVGSDLAGKKIRIHTSVQDMNDNTDDIRVLHSIQFGQKTVARKLNATAANEGDVFDVFTDIHVF